MKSPEHYPYIQKTPSRFITIGDLGLAVDMIASWVPARNTGHTHVLLKDGREFLVPVDFHQVCHIIFTASA